MEKRKPIIKIEHVSKEYRLGAIGGGTLKGDLQSFIARVRGKEDPNLKIGQTAHGKNERFLALDDITFSVYPGERIGIIGHNGAGKSTLLKLLSRVTGPTSGALSFDGRIASMLEVGTGFHPELTGRENVYMNGAILGMTKDEISKKFDDIVEFSEVAKFVDTPVKRYSSGMYVKLAFSVAAHLDSEIMIMDEVLAVGDMQFQNKCLEKMGDVSKKNGRTILYVSHNMNTIRQLCTRCVVLDHGRLIFDGEVDEAISIYAGMKDVTESDMIYDADHHKCSKKYPDGIIRELHVTDGTNCRYDPDSLVHAKMVCNAPEAIDDFRLRFEVHYKDGSIAGTMLSENPVKLKPGRNELDLTLNTEHLARGRYYMDIVAYQSNEYGTQVHLDGVYPGMTLEISDRVNQENHLLWNHNYWGHVRFHGAQISVSGRGE